MIKVVYLRALLHQFSREYLHSVFFSIFGLEELFNKFEILQLFLRTKWGIVGQIAIRCTEQSKILAL